MTMEFKVADPALFAAIKTGASIRFEFVEQPPGEWTVIRATALASTKPSTPSSAPFPAVSPAASPAASAGREAAGRVPGSDPHQGH